MSDEDEMAPFYVDSVPVCVTKCAQYDGKRCKIIGWKPSRVCEPAINATLTLRADLQRVRGENERVRKALERWCAECEKEAADVGVEVTCRRPGRKADPDAICWPEQCRAIFEDPPPPGTAGRGHD